MKKSIFLLLLICSQTLLGQILIGTPQSLILVYNFPDNYFYVEVKGLDKKHTEQQNVFIIDDHVVQILAVPSASFLSPADTPDDKETIIRSYIQWEADYLKNNFGFDINRNFSPVTTPNGSRALMWEYDMPAGEPPAQAEDEKTDPSLKQLFILQVVKNVVVGINMPLFDPAQYEYQLNYLKENIEQIVESPVEIDPEELNRQRNGDNPDQ